MATKEERDARLDALLEATKLWAARQKEYLNAQVSLAENILKGHGSEKISQGTVEKIDKFTVDEINDFLTG